MTATRRDKRRESARISFRVPRREQRRQTRATMARAKEKAGANVDMRITGGQLGSRALKAPKGTLTRPTSDRVREALFNILRDECVGARVLDLYAGTGALGLEAISRGATFAVFVERSKRALAALNANIATLSLRPRPAWSRFRSSAPPRGGTRAVRSRVRRPPLRGREERRGHPGHRRSAAPERSRGQH